jgi:hypothetical protein
MIKDKTMEIVRALFANYLFIYQARDKNPGITPHWELQSAAIQ